MGLPREAIGPPGPTASQVSGSETVFLRKPFGFSKESQPQNPEFRNNQENFHPCICLIEKKIYQVRTLTCIWRPAMLYVYIYYAQ